LEDRLSPKGLWIPAHRPCIEGLVRGRPERGFIWKPYIQKLGGIDIALNAVSVMHVQGTLFADLSLDEFMGRSWAL
jgi:hypothetical protein